MNIIVRWLITALALIGVAYLVDGIEVTSFTTALIVAVLLGFANILIKPILIILTLPINILTLGLFTLVINGFLFWFVASFVEGFEVDSIWVAILGAFLVSIFSFIGNKLFSGNN